MVRRGAFARDVGFFGWKPRLVLVLLCAGLVLAGRHACGQTAVDGAIRGVVRDAVGATVAGATVHVDDSADGIHLVALTEKSGEFVLLRVPPGFYEMTVEASGFRRLVQEVDVALGGVEVIAEDYAATGGRELQRW